MLKRIDKKSALLLLGDWVTIALFVFIGQMEHEMVSGNPLPRLFQTWWVFAVPWAIVAFLWGAYAAPIDLRSFLGKTVTAWLVGIPLALILRAYLQGQAAIIVIFMAITLALGALFMLGWRALYFWLWRRGTVG